MARVWVWLLISVSVFSGPIRAATYSGGSGTEPDPYQLATKADLLLLGTTPTDYGQHFVLTADIDLTNETFSTAVIAADTNHTDATFQGTQFSGGLDGNNHVIRNLTIDTGGEDHHFLGLFGYVNGATVRNLEVENVCVTAGDGDGNLYYVGAVAGYTASGTLTNCLTSGTMTSGNSVYYMGGLCGQVSVTEIEKCSSVVTLSGGNTSRYIGGLLGSVSMCNITHCAANGTVTGGSNSAYAGGLIGSYYHYNGSISDCQATVLVTIGSASTLSGGLIGFFDSSCVAAVDRCRAAGAIQGGTSCTYIGGFCGQTQSGVTINNCYAAGDVNTGSSSYYLGGFCGSNFGTINKSYSVGNISCNTCSASGGFCGDNIDTVSSSFWNTETSGESFSSGGTGKTTAEMQSKATFTGAGWDFTGESTNGTEDIWYMNGYPELNGAGAVTTYALTVDNGSGDGAYEPGQAIPIMADLVPSNHVFHVWSVTPPAYTSLVANLASTNTTFTMPAGNVTLNATYLLGVASLEVDGPLTIRELTQVNYTCTATFNDQSTSNVTLDVTWSENSAYASIDATGLLTASDVPSQVAVTVSAAYLYGGSLHYASQGASIRDLIPHTLTVENGTGDGDYRDRVEVEIAADPPPVDWFFDRWTAAPIGYIGEVASATSSNTTFTMPNNAVTLTANYKPELTSIHISGTTSVAEVSQATYACIATFSDASTQNVAAAALWSEDSPYAEISAVGVLTTIRVDTNESVNISVRHVYRGVTNNDTLAVAILDTLPPPTYFLRVNGGSGQARYEEGALAVVEAYGDFDCPQRPFDRWVVEPAAYTSNFDSVTNALALFTMPAEDVALTTSYQELNTYSGGAGIEGDPFRIADTNDLFALAATRCDYDRHFILVNNIDLAGMVFTNSVISSDGDPNDSSNSGMAFRGSFDGNGHTIRNLTIDTGGANYYGLGLFGSLSGFPGSGGCVEHLALLNVTIRGGVNSQGLGMLAGDNLGMVVRQCFASGSVQGGTNSYYVGGICGLNWNGTVSECFVSADVAGKGLIGGIAGANQLLGASTPSTSVISNCYTMGSARGLGNYAEAVGGICGMQHGDIVECYSTMQTSSDGAMAVVGGLFGTTNAPAGVPAVTLPSPNSVVSSSFWDTETSGTATSYGGSGKSTAEMRTESTFTSNGWDFAGETANGTKDTWYMNGYPKLSCFTNGFWDGYSSWLASQEIPAGESGYSNTPAGDETGNLLKYGYVRISQRRNLGPTPLNTGRY